MNEKIRNSRGRIEGVTRFFLERFFPEKISSGQISVQGSLFYAIVLLGLSILEYFLLVLLLGTILRNIPDEVWSMLLKSKLSYFVFMCALKMIPFFAFIFPFAYYAKPEGILKLESVSREFTVGILMVSGGIAILASNFATGVLYVIELLGLHGYQVSSNVAMFCGLDRMLYLLIVSSLSPALIEEIIFRGIILQSLRRYGELSAIIISSVVFSILHINLAQIIFALIMGLFMGYVMVKTNNILLCILIHFFNNVITCAVWELAENLPVNFVTEIDMVKDIILLIFSVIGIVMLMQKWMTEKGSK